MATTLLGRVVHYERLGRYLKTLRRAKGWSQAQVAEKLSRSKSAVSGWERGAFLGEASLRQLASLYQTSADTILTESGAIESLAIGGPRRIWLEAVLYLMTPCGRCGKPIPIELSPPPRSRQEILCCRCRTVNDVALELPDMAKYQAAIAEQMRQLNADLGFSPESGP